LTTIEQRTGAISLIFELEGEKASPARAQVIADLCARQSLVLATGSGAILREEAAAACAAVAP
jgi:shikimate kinase